MLTVNGRRDYFNKKVVTLVQMAQTAIRLDMEVIETLRSIMNKENSEINM